MAEPRRSKGETTREALMTAAFAVFAEKGFLRAQIGDIVRAAGKSNGVFHIYFRNKEALLDAWLDRVDTTVPWYHADTELLFGKARHFVLESFWALYDGYGPILQALDAAALGSEHFRTRLSAIHGKGDASIARMIRHAQGEGRFIGIDPELAAISLAAMITRTTAYWFRHRSALEARGFGKETLIAHLETFFARMIGVPSESGAVPSEGGRDGSPAIAVAVGMAQ